MSARNLTRFSLLQHRARLGECAQSGFTLIELMIAMVLGLIVIGGVISVFIAGQRSYTTNKALGDVQDSSRIAFEMMARDIRDAGLTGCDNSGRIANVLNDASTDWFANFGNALHGYTGSQTDPAVTTGTATTNRVAGTDSLELIGAGDTGLTVAKHNPTSANFKLNETTTSLKDGDVVLVCDPNHAAIFQITNYNSSNVTVVHNTGTGTPGNCSKGLGYPTVCTTNGNSYEFGQNSQFAVLAAVDWYIGVNPVSATGRSLYRINVQNSGGTPTGVSQEMVRDVTDMKILYHQVGKTSLLAADSITDWSSVDAAQVTLTLESVDKRAGTDTKPITRTFTATTTVRNRVK